MKIFVGANFTGTNHENEKELEKIRKRSASLEGISDYVIEYSNFQELKEKLKSVL